jgi:3D (Asp-Asp-Asp) domain-containing protein
MPILGALVGFSLLLGSVAIPLGAPAASKPLVVAPEVPVQPSYTVALTGYNAVPGQTDDTPFETASGAYSNPEVVAARTSDLADELPFGTIIEIDGSGIAPDDDNCGYGMVAPHIGYRVIEDSMNARLSDRVDILFATSTNYTNKVTGEVRNASDVVGICKGAVVRVVGHVDFAHIPKTQAALAALVTGKGENLAVK